MRVLHVVSGVHKGSGGTSEVVPRMCEALVSAGHEVRILTLDWGEVSDAATRARKAGVNITFCRRNKVPVLKGLGFSKEFSCRIRDSVGWADVIHLHGLWQWPCWRAVSEAWRQNKPYVMQTHGFLEPERLKKSHLKKIIIGRLIERPRLEKAKAIIATAESERESVLAYGIHIPVEIVPIGLDMTDIDQAVRDDDLLDRLTEGALKKPDNSRKKVLLYFSRIAPIKGLDMLAEAWAQLSEFHYDWHLLIVGPDDRGYAEVIREKFHSLNPQLSTLSSQPSYTIHGPVFGDDKFKLLKSVEAFVLPTRSENFSIAVQEALAAGVPVVCTKGAPWQFLEGDVDVGIGQCGHWVEISSSGIAYGLRDIVSMDDEGRARFGRNGTQLVKSRFGWSGVTEALLKVYHEVLEA